MNVIDDHIISLIQNGIANMSNGEERELSEIIDAEVWEAIPKGKRLKIGKAFKISVLSGAFPQLRFKETRSDNHKIYQKM